MARISPRHSQWWAVRRGARGWEVGRLDFFQPSQPGTWEPLINAFRCQGCLRICVELAGVDKEQIDLQVEPRRLLIRGSRSTPEPSPAQGRAEQILALEIDHGPFTRELHLPAPVNIDTVTAHQREGLLWIELPLLEQT